MGNPLYGYREVLIDYMEYYERETNWNFRYSKEERKKLYDLPITGLERKALTCFPNNVPLSFVTLGFCIMRFVNEYHDYCDMMNAFAGSMDMLYKLFGVIKNDESEDSNDDNFVSC